MTVKVRLSGDPDDINQLIEHLRGEFEVAGGDRAYPNRGSFGVRVYLELRPARDRPTPRTRSERVQPEKPSRKEVEP
jgi:hypothetical protein